VLTLGHDGGGNLTGIQDVDSTTRTLGYDGAHYHP
jgi:YD repeat-containing protein